MTQFAPIQGPRGADWRQLLDEMEELARSVARGGPPARSDATAYLEVRAALLGSDVAELLPGFLLQCHSIHRLREFLTLYDPEHELREAFMVRAFERCRAAIDVQPRKAKGGESKEWMW